MVSAEAVPTDKDIALIAIPVANRVFFKYMKDRIVYSYFIVITQKRVLLRILLLRPYGDIIKV